MIGNRQLGPISDSAALLIVWSAALGVQLLVLWMVISMVIGCRPRGQACAAPQPGPAPRDVAVLLAPVTVLFVAVNSQQEFQSALSLRACRRIDVPSCKKPPDGSLLVCQPTGLNR